MIRRMLTLLLMDVMAHVHTQCTRYPGPCQGPFVIRPSIHSSFNRTCQAELETTMTNCMVQCREDQCCRAFGVDTAGNCTTTPIVTEEYDYVKEIPKTMVTPQICIDGLQTCHITIGRIGGDQYNLQNEFLAADSDVARIDVSERLLIANWPWPVYTRLAFTFRDGTQAAVPSGATDPPTTTCWLAEGEYITGITTYSNKDINGVQYGLDFHTTRKTCGTYGTHTYKYESSTWPTYAFSGSGNRLLYMNFRAGLAFDEYALAFEGGCTEDIKSWMPEN